MDEWNFRFPGSLFIVGLYIKVLRIWEWIWSLLKLSKVRLTASYSKIAMKPSSPEISRLQMEAGYLQMLIQTGEKKKVKCLSHTELSRYCKQQIWSITIRSIYMHSISVTPKGHTLVFYLWPWQLPKNIYCHCLCKLQIFWASPNLLPLHKTPIRSYPACQQALGICAERYKLTPDLTGKKLDALFWWPHSHKNLMSTSSQEWCSLGWD